MTDKTVAADAGMKRKARLGRVARLAPAAAILLVMGVGHDASNQASWLGLAPSTATAAAPALPAPPASGEMGFVVVSFHPPNYNGDDSKDCPDGTKMKLRDMYLRTLPQAEQDRLNLKENENEREAKWKKYGTNAQGGNVCSNVYEFLDRPPTPMMKGPVAWGLDLDNDASGAGKDPYTCAHADFTTPTGMKGADNQVWRVFGCNTLFRGTTGDGKSADLPMGYDNHMQTGEWTQVIILKGVNSLVNDPDVQVIYANTDDRPVTDSRGQFVQRASFTIASAGRKLTYRNELHGKIVNGVLMTDTKDIHLSQAPGRFDLAHGRLRMEFQPDGTVKGMTGGYEPIGNITQIARGGGAGSVNVAGTDCAGEYNAMRMMADGDKDPKTGRCSRISTAYGFDAVPAFVNDVVPAQKISSK